MASRRITLWALLCAGFFHLAQGVAVGAIPPVLLSEVMYHPESGDLRENFVELTSLGSASVDLSGWQLTDGMNYRFPAGTVLAGGGQLVVAADLELFHLKHPGVTNVVAGWDGAIRSHLQLRDATGNVVNEVNYSTDGDWAERVLTLEGFASYGHLGWEWVAGHDGRGRSLELINPRLPNTAAQNWGSSINPGGTPGQPNSIAQSNVPPLILNVAHTPAVPRSTDPVAISGRVVSEAMNGVKARLFFRDASTLTPPPFADVPMEDDGLHGDGLAGDGIYGAVLPPQSAGTVVEFYIQASDAAGRTRTYPVFTPSSSSPRTANLLYQVDDGVYAGAQPLYRIIMTEIERLELYRLARGCGGANSDAAMDSDAQMNATWVSTQSGGSVGANTQVRYNVGVRNRGHGSRASNPNNYHINIPGDRSWKRVTGINLNSQYAYSQVLASAIFRRLGIPMAESQAVQVRVNSTNLMSLSGLPDNNSFGSYAANEQYNGDFIARAFPLDPYGISYRGIRDQASCDPSRNSVADLAWRGPDFKTAVYTNAYFQQNNFHIDGGPPLLDLIAVLNSTNGYSAENYVSDVRDRVNVAQWMKFFAVNTLLDNTETSIASGAGDDYALYRGALDQQFQLLPYDLDSVMGRGLTSIPPTHSLFRMTALPVMERFMRTPAFAPVYFAWLRNLGETAFSPAELNPVIDQVLGDYVPTTVSSNLKTFNAAHVRNVLSQIPNTLSVSNSLPIQDGWPRTSVGSVPLVGRADAVRTRRVLINGSPATWVAWRAEWTADAVLLQPGLNRLLIQALDEADHPFDVTVFEVWFDDGNVEMVGGLLLENTTWTPAGGPYQLTSNLTVASNITLTVAAGTSVYLGPEVSLVVAPGGRILAEGTATAPIRFAAVPGAAAWGNLRINGSAGSQESRISYAHIDGNGTTAIVVSDGALTLTQTSFGTTSKPYLSLDRSSFLISRCYFPSTTAAFEPVHGTGGVRSGGRGVIRECFFGSTSGYNDVVDFTGGNRELNEPIVQFFDNVFVGGGDDLLDLDGTDAWIEGNIFLHIHKNGAPDSSSAVSGGDSGGRTSELTLVRNLFYDCDQAATAKQGNFYVLLNNTIVRTTRTGGTDSESGVINMRDVDPGPPTTFGAGMYLEGNIIVDAEQLVRNYDPAQTSVTLSNNLLSEPWSGPGGGNLVANPLLRHIPTLAETQFTNWTDAQILRQWFGLLPGSPGRGTGPNGNDQGGVVPDGATISGEPPEITPLSDATLSVGVTRSGGGIPATGWPQGAGYTHYRWRLDGGAWSTEIPTVLPIELHGLAKGPHRVDVSGKLDSGFYQDSSELGADLLLSSSKTWTVDPAFHPSTLPTIRINEVLALNSGTLSNGITTPDVIELHNFGTNDVSLAGTGLSDDALAPYKFVFPTETPKLGPGDYLIVFADAASSQPQPGVHLGFGLNANGDSVYLHQAVSDGGQLLDEVHFGLQISDLTIGRGSDGEWTLCSPTLGKANIPAMLGPPSDVRINEWLTDAIFVYPSDFLELYNRGSSPVALGGLHLSNAEGAFGLFEFAKLSFIAPGNYVVLHADAEPDNGSDHLNFKLSPNGGVLALSDPALRPLDIVSYGPQRADVAEGRTPSGADSIALLRFVTPGGPNPNPAGGTVNVTNLVTTTQPLVAITNQWRFDNSGADLGTAWTQPTYDDSLWSVGVGLFGHESTPLEYPYPFATFIPAPDQVSGHITFYLRTHFNWDGSASAITLVATNFVDDGAVIYLNGVRVGALRMPNTVTYSTTASNQPNEGVAEILTLQGSPFPGDNVIAVEVHQANSNSSDLAFGLELSAVQTSTNVVTSIIPGIPIVLNEVSAGKAALANLTDGTTDWLELFNPSTNAVALRDVSLSDDPTSPRKWSFSSGAMIAAGGYQWIACDGSAPASDNNTGFALNAAGGALFLYEARSNNVGLIDSVTYGLQTPEFSVGRSPDGAETWNLTQPTPGTTNIVVALGSLDSLAINEWMADPDSGSDWFELLNFGARPLALGGLYLTGDLTKPTGSLIPPLSFIGSGAAGFIQFVADNNPSAGPRHVPFKLNKGGESIGVYSSEGTLITAVTFGSQQHNVSEGRFPDGSTNIVRFPVATPARSNVLTDANGDGLPDDWQSRYFDGPSDPHSAPGADPDDDGLTNREEYIAGTDPTDRESSVQLQVANIAPDKVTLQFKATAGRDYRVFYRTDLTAGEWVKLADIPSRLATTLVSVDDDSQPVSSVKFYQLVVSPAP